MNTKASAQNSSSTLDSVKWVFVAVLVVGGIYGYHYFTQYPVLYRVLALIPVVAAALVLGVLTERGAALWDLVKQARMEIFKVVWPTRQETTQTTLIVVLVVFLMAIILWLLDMFFGWLASLIIG